MDRQTLKGVLLVIFGASSCAVVGVIVKLAVTNGYRIPEIILSQTLVAVLILAILYVRSKSKAINKEPYMVATKDRYMLILGGIPLALTNTFYYLSIQHIPVAVATVMLMQSVWLGVIIDWLMHQVKPSTVKIVAIVVILIGTIFATDLINTKVNFNYLGILYGFLAAISYSFTFLVTNNIGKQYSPVTRSTFIVLGAFIVISIIWGRTVIYQQFDPLILCTWSPIIALFSMILPPILLNKGMPLIDIGLGSIVASMELPVTALTAYLLIGEKANIHQLLGILLILLAIVCMNIYSPKPK